MERRKGDRWIDGSMNQKSDCPRHQDLERKGNRWSEEKSDCPRLEDRSLVHACGYYNRTLLHVASLHGWVDVAKCLIDYGADVNAQRSYLSQSSDHSQSPNSPNLKTLCSKGHLKEALLQMAFRGLENVFKDYDTVLTECINQRAIREGQRVHTHLIKTHYDPPPYLSTEPNEFTFASILTSCVGPSGFDQGRQVHSLVIQSSFESHIFVGSSLLDMYAKAGRIHEARGVFDCLPERDVVSCTAIISSYAQLGLDEEALKLFRQLQKEGMDSNYVTYASVLTSLSGLAALNHGRQVHGHVLRSELPFYVVLQNSLIDMYSKCGNLTYSRRVFDNMSERDVISWNAMIMGWEEVRNLREMMKEKTGTKDPDTQHFSCKCRSHPRMEEVSAKMKDISIKIKETGYAPHLSSDYHDWGILLGHGEKLALAFGLMETSEGVPTQGIKNLPHVLIATQLCQAGL
ncbi:Pentatricopeptide repeat [Dillenia turbinata]|uniref:Pentatricopeptide repeat n=1 Tax=Dillenia turbinata TaxID=194707 RepID=A0AAN8VX37_9MAGN